MKHTMIMNNQNNYRFLFLKINFAFPNKFVVSFLRQVCIEEFEGRSLMRQIAATDKLRRLKVVLHEVERNALRFITHCQAIPLERRMKAQFRLDQLPVSSSEHYHRRRCINTGNPRMVIKDFNLSRHEFKRLAMEGKLPGIIKAKW